MLKRIHINQHNIKHNGKEPNDIMPVITVKLSNGQNHYGYNVEILGESTVHYKPKEPLPCGAKVWIETDAPVILYDICGIDFLRLN